MVTRKTIALTLLLAGIASKATLGQNHDGFRLSRGLTNHTVDPKLVSVRSVTVTDRGTTFRLLNHSSSPVLAVVLVFQRLDPTGKQVGDGRVLYDALTVPPFAAKPIPVGGMQEYFLGTPPVSRIQDTIRPFLTAVVLEDGRTSGSPESINWILGQRRVYRDAWADILQILKAHQGQPESTKGTLIAELEAARDRRLKAEKDSYVEGFIQSAFQDCITNISFDLPGDAYKRRLEQLLARFSEGQTRLSAARLP